MSLDFNAVAVTLAGTGWKPYAGEQEPTRCSFEDPARCLHLTIYGDAKGEHWVVVESSFFQRGTRKRYQNEPVIHANHAAGREAAEVLRTELKFLKTVHGINNINVGLHRTARGNSARGLRKDVIKDVYYIGFKS